MNRISTLLLLLTIVAIQSCKKDNEHLKDSVVNVSLSPGEEYRLNLKQYGKESPSATIAQQAINYSVSEIIPSAMTYHYQSSTKSGITDKVIIKITSSKHGNCGNHDDDDDDERNDELTSVTVNFTIN